LASSPPSCPLSPGQPVAVYPLLPCGRCPACRAGLGQLCADYDYLGSRRDGGFARYVAVPVANLLPLPPGVSLEDAALAEPAAVALHALRRGELAAGEWVWIVGAGPIGLLLAQWARALGARPLITDVDPAKLALAARWLAPEHILDSRAADPLPWVHRLTAGGADLVVEAVGLPDTVRQAVLGARQRGRVVLMGNPAGPVALAQGDYWQILRRELTLLGTWNSSCQGSPQDDWHTVLAALAAGRLELAPLVSHRVCLAELPGLLKRMYQRREPYVKVLVIPKGE